MPEEEAAPSTVSHDDAGSSGDETAHHVSTDSAGASKKRKRGKYQKTSYVFRIFSSPHIPDTMPSLLSFCPCTFGSRSSGRHPPNQVHQDSMRADIARFSADVNSVKLAR